MDDKARLDWFAGQALASGLLSYEPLPYPTTPKHLAERAYTIAAAMLAESKKREPK